jgi:glycosyltransferase involved in cell wall biosynthesis
MDVTVCIGTFGDKSWIDLAKRAIASVPNDVPVIHRHEESLSAARNACLESVSTEWVIHLDADDELEPGYIDAMAQGTADVRAPMARYMVNGIERNLWQPRVWGHTHDCTGECLTDGNWLLIGCAVRADMLREIGGWHEHPWSEDWCTWIRCWQAGASFELVREAIYRAHVRPDSRNRGATQRAKNEAHWEIHRENFPEQYAAVA